MTSVVTLSEDGDDSSHDHAISNSSSVTGTLSLVGSTLSGSGLVANVSRLVTDTLSLVPVAVAFDANSSLAGSTMSGSIGVGSFVCPSPPSLRIGAEYLHITIGDVDIYQLCFDLEKVKYRLDGDCLNPCRIASCSLPLCGFLRLRLHDILPCELIVICVAFANEFSPCYCSECNACNCIHKTVPRQMSQFRC
jgi:hypothetical protein